jgi:polysaccharide export outer membrane protein
MGAKAMSNIKSKFKPFLSLLIVAGSLLLSSCGTDPNYSKVTPAATTIAPLAPVADTLPEYKVQIGDVLDVSFYLNPEFNETVTVRPDGMISTKIIEEMYVYNKTVKDINNQVKAAYARELKDPRVNTIVRSFAPIRIYVSGEVNAPGEYVVVGQALTLTQAIARAGGVKNSALWDKVIILRRGAGEKEVAYQADYYAATQGGDASKDVRLAADDVVYVPRTGVDETYIKYQQHFQQFVNPSTGASIGAAYTIK